VTESRVRVAHIVTNEGVVQNDRVVILLVTVESVHDAIGHRAGTSSIDTNVLIVSVSAEVLLESEQVLALYGTTRLSNPVLSLESSGGTHHGPVNFVSQDVNQVIKGTRIDVLGGYPLRGAMEMGSSAVSQDGSAVVRSGIAKLLFIRNSVLISSVDSIAVVINIWTMVRSFTSRINAGLEVIAISSSPRNSTKSRDSGEVVSIEINQRLMVLNKTVDPLHRVKAGRNFQLNSHLLIEAQGQFLSGSREQTACIIGADLQLLANTIRSLTKL